jgi:hypothetical protein
MWLFLAASRFQFRAVAFDQPDDIGFVFDSIQRRLLVSGHFEAPE